MKSKISFILPGKPLSTNTIYRRQNRGRMYMTQKGRDKKIFYQTILKNQYRGDIITGDIEIYVKLYFSDKRIRDIDNYSKILNDSLEGNIISNDKQIQKSTIEKSYDPENSRIEITIYY